jgi:hypothetical protein
MFGAQTVVFKLAQIEDSVLAIWQRVAHRRREKRRLRTKNTSAPSLAFPPAHR